MLNILLSPFSLLFFIMILGFAIGRIHIYKFSIGIAGVLFVAIITGAVITRSLPAAQEQMFTDTQNTMKIFSKIGSSLFVSVIGLQTGISLKGNSKGALRSFLIGIFMSAAGVVTMKIISFFDATVNISSLLGALCGALTSTPALSSVCELSGNNGNDVVFGYGVAYLFGVCLTVLFSQMLTPKQPCKKEKTAQLSAVTNRSCHELILISIVALVGNIIGDLHMPILGVSLGGTAATLVMGLLIGLLTKYIFVKIQLSKQSLEDFKKMGLSMFFVGTGYSTGVQAVSFDMRLIIYGVVITLSAIIIGIVLCRLLLYDKRGTSAFVIAGGMTSSPAYGAISENKSEISTSYFSFSYFGALIALIIFVQIIAR